MNKRIRKKKAKKYCAEKTNGEYAYGQCDKCGWDSLEDGSHSQVICTSVDGDVCLIHCKCPVCGNSYEYWNF